MKLQVICAVLLLASTHAITENDPDVWVESAEEKMTEDLSGSPVPTTCQAVAESLTMYGALAFVHNSKAGPFACKQAWNQELARASVWLRGSLGSNSTDMAIHVARRAKRSHQDGESKEGGSGRVHMKEKKYGLDGSVKKVSAYNKLKNKYELLGAYPITSEEVPEIVRRGGQELVADDETVSLGWIEETDAELKAFNVQEYKPSAESLLSVPSSYNFESQNPDCAANKIVNQGGCGSCWAFASAKAYSMSLYHQSKGQYNINLAEQDLLSCTPETGSFYLRSSSIGQEVVKPQIGKVRNGCEGGNAVGAWGPMQASGRVTRTCDPYTGFAGVMTNRIRKEGASVDSCGSHISMCKKTGQKDLSYKVDKIFMIDGKDTEAIKSAIMTYGPVYVGVTWDGGLSGFKSGVYTRPVGNIGGGHAMVIVGWGTERGNPYWMIANSHGINNNDKGHIKWGMRSSNPISRVYAVKVQLPSKCQNNKKCMNGGAFEDDCQCRCVPPYSGSTCSSCGLTCKNGGSRVSGKCACKCPVGYFGDDCSNYILAEYIEADAWCILLGAISFSYRCCRSAKIRIRWDLKEFHSGKNVIERTVNPDGTGRCSNCPILATINSKKGQATGSINFGSGFGGRPWGEQCHTARLSLGTNEFGASKGYITNQIPCLKLGAGASQRTRLTGQSGACLCGGTQPSKGSLGTTLGCPRSSYTRDCCPENSQNCLGRTGR